MRTIESFEDYVDPIQGAIDDLLLPTLFGQTEPLPSDLRQLVTLTPAPLQFAASTLITAPHVDSITTQHVHGGRRESHGGVKKTTSSLENCVGEFENGKY